MFAFSVASFAQLDPSNLHGNWQVVSTVSSTGGEQPKEDVKLNFFADGSCKINMNGRPVGGTWTLVEKVLTIEITITEEHKMELFSMDVTKLSDSEMILKTEDEGVEITMTLNKV